MPRIPDLPNPVILSGKLADWRCVLSSHYKRLGHTSRRRRFMIDLPNAALQDVADRASPDIVLGVRAAGRVVGVLELFKGLDAHAEIGISVEDAYHRQGYGKALFLEGLLSAEALGVRTADLYFASENRGIRSLVKSAGGKILQRGADCEAHIDIRRCNACRALGLERPWPKATGSSIDRNTKMPLQRFAGSF
jgi:GNAT superfamily N-acetyltransferase